MKKKKRPTPTQNTKEVELSTPQLKKTTLLLANFSYWRMLPSKIWLQPKREIYRNANYEDWIRRITVTLECSLFNPMNHIGATMSQRELMLVLVFAIHKSNTAISPCHSRASFSSSSSSYSSTSSCSATTACRLALYKPNSWKWRKFRLILWVGGVFAPR